MLCFTASRKGFRKKAALINVNLCKSAPEVPTLSNRFVETHPSPSFPGEILFAFKKYPMLLLDRHDTESPAWKVSAAVFPGSSLLLQSLVCSWTAQGHTVCLAVCRVWCVAGLLKVTQFVLLSSEFGVQLDCSRSHSLSCCLQKWASLQHWAVQSSWFAQVKALYNLSRKKLREVVASLSGWFLSRRCFTLWITVEVEPRLAKQYKCQYCCVCKNYCGKGMEGGIVCIIFWLTRRLWVCGKNMFCGLL